MFDCARLPTHSEPMWQKMAQSPLNQRGRKWLNLPSVSVGQRGRKWLNFPSMAAQNLWTSRREGHIQSRTDNI